jgi:hypothetical protein
MIEYADTTSPKSPYTMKIMLNSVNMVLQGVPPFTFEYSFVGNGRSEVNFWIRLHSNRLFRNPTVDLQYLLDPVLMGELTATICYAPDSKYAHIVDPLITEVSYTGATSKPYLTVNLAYSNIVPVTVLLVHTPISQLMV